MINNQQRSTVKYYQLLIIVIDSKWRSTVLCQKCFCHWSSIPPSSCITVSVYVYSRALLFCPIIIFISNSCHYVVQINKYTHLIIPLTLDLSNHQNLRKHLLLIGVFFYLRLVPLHYTKKRKYIHSIIPLAPPRCTNKQLHLVDNYRGFKLKHLLKFEKEPTLGYCLISNVIQMLQFVSSLNYINFFLMLCAILHNSSQ